MKKVEFTTAFGTLFDSIATPEIRMPMRKDDCPAAPVCEAVGNLRGFCVKGSSLMHDGTQACMANLILLISRLAGMWPKEMIDVVEEKRRRIGFDAS